MMVEHDGAASDSGTTEPRASGEAERVEVEAEQAKDAASDDSSPGLEIEDEERQKKLAEIEDRMSKISNAVELLQL